MPKLIPARVITPDTIQVSSHMLGSPALSLKLAHLRLGHMNMADTAKTLGLPLTRTPPCNVCNLFKAKSPSAGTSTSQPEVIGALVHIDAFGPFQVAALVTGHKFIVAAVDGREKVVDFESYHEPTGAFCAAYIERLHRTYATMYRAELKAVRFDNASVFNCEHQCQAGKLEDAPREQLALPALSASLRTVLAANAARRSMHACHQPAP
jgi:hypothetical protein